MNEVATGSRPLTLEALRAAAQEVRAAGKKIAEVDAAIFRIVVLHAASRHVTWREARTELVAAAPEADRADVAAAIDGAHARAIGPR